jgi:hypothetical protein
MAELPPRRGSLPTKFIILQSPRVSRGEAGTIFVNARGAIGGRVTNGASNRFQQIFSPGNRVFTKTGKTFVIEEIGEKRIRFRLLAGHGKMSLRQSTLAHLIDNFEDIRDSENLEEMIRLLVH